MSDANHPDPPDLDPFRSDPPDPVDTLGWVVGRASREGSPVDPQRVEPASPSRVTDDELRAYRERTLSVDSRRAIEAALLADGRLRRRLALLDRATVEEKDASLVLLQDRVLAAFEASWPQPSHAATSSPQPPRQSAGRGSRRRVWAGFLALAACALFAVVLIWQRPEPLPADLDYHFVGQGLAEFRSSPDPAKQDVIRALPTTVIRLTARPNRAVKAQVLLYWKGSSPSYERLMVAPATTDERGVWQVEILASELLGSFPAGRGTLVLAVIPVGQDLPARLDAQQLAALASQHRLQSRKLEIEWLAAEPGPEVVPPRRSP